MVASISARGNAKAALAYYDHLRQDDYYTRDGEPPGRWAGGAAARLSLLGPVTSSEFEAALNGIDPKTSERLVQRSGQAHRHAAGWDMTFSAPKSVSVLWALSEPKERAAIEAAQRAAVMAATTYLEREAAWSRRGQGGSHREQAACLLVAQFDHYTSRELDPQLHTHCFVFNLAPRRDGSWGAIVSRELYKAQKQAGAIYRNALVRELEQQGHMLRREGDTVRVAVIPRHVERAFSKRRQAIEEAVAAHGYQTAKGMELAALRTRQAKKATRGIGLFAKWRTEARMAGLEPLSTGHQRRDLLSASLQGQGPKALASSMDTSNSNRSERSTDRGLSRVPLTQVGPQLGRLLNALKQPSRMPGIKFRLRVQSHERDL